MEYKVVSLKANGESVEQALAIAEIEIEKSFAENVGAIKFIHGYGSSGKGGAICLNLRHMLDGLFRHKKIKQIIYGVDFNIQNPATRQLLKLCENASLDKDLNHQNGGITIIIL